MSSFTRNLKWNINHSASCVKAELLKSRLTNMLRMIMLFIESGTFNIQLTARGSRTSTDKIKLHLD